MTFGRRPCNRTPEGKMVQSYPHEGISAIISSASTKLSAPSAPKNAIFLYSVAVLSNLNQFQTSFKQFPHFPVLFS